MSRGVKRREFDIKLTWVDTRGTGPLEHGWLMGWRRVLDVNQRQSVSKDVSNDVRAAVEWQELVFQRRASGTCPVNQYVLADGKRFWRSFILRCEGGRE